MVVFLGFAGCVVELLLGVVCCALAKSGEAASPKQIRLEIHAFCRGKASFKRIPSASLSIKTCQIIYLETLVNLKFYVNTQNIGFIPTFGRTLLLGQRKCQIKCGAQRRGVSNPFASDIERCAVVNTGAYEGQSDGDVDALI